MALSQYSCRAPCLPGETIRRSARDRGGGSLSFDITRAQDHEPVDNESLAPRSDDRRIAAPSSGAALRRTRRFRADGGHVGRLCQLCRDQERQAHRRRPQLGHHAEHPRRARPLAHGRLGRPVRRHATQGTDRRGAVRQPLAGKGPRSRSRRYRVQRKCERQHVAASGSRLLVDSPALFGKHADTAALRRFLAIGEQGLRQCIL